MMARVIMQAITLVLLVAAFSSPETDIGQD